MPGAPHLGSTYLANSCPRQSRRPRRAFYPRGPVGPGATAAAWDPLDKSLLRASDELYRDGLVSDATWRALSEKLDTGLMMSAIFTTSDYRAISLSLNTYGVQLDDPGDERLPQVPAR